MPRNYSNRPLPTLQLMAKVSSFDGQRINGVDTTTDYGYDVTTSDFRPVTNNSTFRSNALSSLLHREEDLTAPPPSNGNTDDYVCTTNHVVGGVASRDPWKTTNSLMSDKNSNKQSHSGLRRINLNNTVSPITGKSVTSYTNNDRDADNKQSQSNISSYQAPEYDVNSENEDHPLMEKLRKDLAARGGGMGILNLGRKFRIMDDDNSKSLSSSEFRKAMRETSLNLNDSDITMLYRLFDRGGDGHISYDEFLTTLAGRLNDRRKALVAMAYNSLDKDGSGVVDIEDFKLAYDVSFHPDFIAKKKTKDQILREMLDVFDEGVKDGVVTRKEFLNYYSAISASIDNDDYFELMIRNAWRMSGGEGMAANTANKRVLVRGADGSERVVEIKNELGLKRGDKADMMNRLNQQGERDIGGLSETGMVDNRSDARRSGGRPTTSTSSSSGTYRGGSGASGGYGNSLSVSGCKTGVSSAPSSYGTPSKPLVTSGIVRNTNAKPSDEDMAENEDHPLMEKLRKDLAARGGGMGILNLGRKFRIMDDDNSKSLSSSEFRKAMRETSLNLNDSDITMLYRLFDRGGDGHISYDEFLTTLAGRLNDRRKALVAMAYNSLDKDGSGVVDIEDFKLAYDVSFHPDFIAKKKTKDQILREMLDVFDEGVKDGVVTRKEFLNYYSAISASIDNDDYFELMIRNAWRMSGGEGMAANTANKRVLVRGADGSERVVEIKNELGLKRGDKADMMNRLNQQGERDIGGLSETGMVDNRSDARRSGGRPTTSTSSSSGTYRGGSGASGGYGNTLSVSGSKTGVSSAPSSYGTPSKPLVTSGIVRNTNAKPSDEDMAENEDHPLMEKLRKDLAARGGGMGILNLGRKFRIMDDDNSKSLSSSEFRKAMRETSLNLNDSDITMLYRLFDRGGDGHISYDEFLTTLAGRLNDRRKALVVMAYNSLDKDGSGVVDIEDFKLAYDVSFHPDFIAKKKTKDQILREMLDVFDEGVKDGVVIRKEFLNYYSAISASIDNDDYFELMIRNAWRMSGGEGMAANTANKRVLVRGADGSERVVEIKNELGLKRGDKADMMNRLNQQGERDIGGLSETGMVDNRSDARRSGGRPATSTASLSSSANRSNSSAVCNDPAVNKVASTLLTILTETKTIIPLVKLQRALRKIESNQRQTMRGITLNDFKMTLMNMSINIPFSEIKLVFDYLDSKKTGLAKSDDIIQLIQGPMKPNRQQLLDQIYRHLSDASNNQMLPVTILHSYCNVANHPDVLSKKVTLADMNTIFVNYFDYGMEKSGYISYKEFINYYSHVSTLIDKDDYFELMIRNVWNISRDTTKSNTNNTMGSQEENKDDIYRPPNLLNQLLGKKPTTLMNQTLASPEKLLKSSYSSPSDMDIATAGPDVPNDSSNSTTNTNNLRNSMNNNNFMTPKVQVPPGIHMVINKIKDTIKSKGKYGYIDLQRLFWANDLNGDSRLDLMEFKTILKCDELNVSTIDNKDIQQLFAYFDRNNDNTIDYEEFLDGIRDPISPARLAIVNQTFQLLDKSHQKMIDTNTVATQYDASNHPEVIARRNTSEQIYQDFLENFDVGKEREGYVTHNEFMNYYKNISSMIINDDYFILMVRNTWKVNASAMNNNGNTGNYTGSEKVSMVDKFRSMAISPRSSSTTTTTNTYDQPILTASDQEIINDLQKQAVQKYNRKLYTHAIKFFELIRQKYDSIGISRLDPNYIMNEKSITACLKYC